MFTKERLKGHSPKHNTLGYILAFSLVNHIATN